MNFDGKVVVVTGGATGIGFGIANAFHHRGARVVLAQPEWKIGEDAAQAIGPNAVAVETDVSHPESVRRMISIAVTRFGQIDILINNAAVTGNRAIGRFLDSPMALVNELIDVNLKGTVWCSQLVAAHMKQQRLRGSIIQISSVGAIVGQDGASIYCATKAAQLSLTRSMALELASLGIRVNAIAPGDIDCGEDPRAGTGGGYKRQTPLGRRGAPNDIANAALYLASEEAAFVTGATLVVDGGWTAC